MDWENMHVACDMQERLLFRTCNACGGIVYGCPDPECHDDHHVDWREDCIWDNDVPLEHTTKHYLTPKEIREYQEWIRSWR